MNINRLIHGNGVERLLLHVICELRGAELPSKEKIGQNVRFPHGLKGVVLHPNTIIEDDVTISQYAYLCTAGHKTDEVNSKDYGLLVSPITIKKGAWIGTRAYIGMGVEIGRYAIVGATASVYKDVEDNHIVGGNPAKYIKNRIINNTQFENVDNITFWAPVILFKSMLNNKIGISWK